MLADQQIDRRDVGKAEKADAVELGLLALDDRPDIAVADRIGKSAVKLVVRIRKAVRIVAGLSLLGDRTFGLHERHLGQPRSAASRMMPSSSALLTKRARLIGLQRDAADEGAALRPDLDQPIIDQPDDRLANRRAAGPKAETEFVFREPFARAQSHADDIVSDGLVDRRRTGGPRPAEAKSASPASCLSSRDRRFDGA